MSKPHTRITLPLTGTIQKAQASLDHRSLLALEYAQTVLPGPKAPTSAIIRRALALYVMHLGALIAPGDVAQEASLRALNLQQEATAVAQAAKVALADKDTAKAAWDRLDAMRAASGVDAPLYPFLDVLYGPGHREAHQALNERAEELAQAAMHRRRRPPRVPSCASGSGA